MKQLSNRQNIAYWLDYIMQCRIGVESSMSTVGWRYMLNKVNSFRRESAKK